MNNAQVPTEEVGAVIKHIANESQYLDRWRRTCL